MKKHHEPPDLQQERLKQHPFGVPDGYFESFSERLQMRIRQEEGSAKPVRRLVGSTRFRLAIAAGLLGAALISYSIVRFATQGNSAQGGYPDTALLEQMNVIDDDVYFLGLMESDIDEELDEDEAFATQAIDYLAVNDVDMVLLFE